MECEEEEKKTLKTYQKLKDEAYDKFNNLKKQKDIDISEIEKIIEIYDIDPIINNFYLEKSFEICSAELKKIDALIKDTKDKSKDNSIKLNVSDLGQKKESLLNDFMKKYLYYINSLSLSQKKTLNEKIQKNNNIKVKLKSFINNKSNLAKIKQIFEFIQSSDFNKKELKNKFMNEYFVDVINFHIPIIYGTNELRYSAVLYDIYSFLFVSEVNEQKTDCQNIYTKIENYENNIIQKIKPGGMLEEKFGENINETEKQTNNDKKISYKNEKFIFLRYFLQGISDEDIPDFLQEKTQLTEDDILNFKEGYTLNHNINFTLYCLLYLDLVMYCYLNYKSGITKVILIIEKMFETIFFKIRKIKAIKREFKAIEINNQKKNDFFEAKIRCFNPDGSGDYFEFNPNEYILENILITENFPEFKAQFENDNNYSLYGHYKNNFLMKDEKLNNTYKDNIISMLKSKIIDEAFNEFRSYQQFKNPFKNINNKEFIEQIDKIKLYIFFPVKDISGLTFKIFGIICINTLFRNIENINTENKIVKLSINISNKKITECHEIIAHYMILICRANSKDVCLLTPDKTFLNYYSNNNNYILIYDGGDRLESVLFGNKIIYLTIRSSLFILNEINWDKDSIDLFRDEFIKLNKLEDINIFDISKENPIIKQLIDNKDFKIDSNIINVKKKNSFVVFRRSYHIGEIDENILYDSDEEEGFFAKFSLTSNAFIPMKSLVPDIIMKNNDMITEQNDLEKELTIDVKEEQ